MGRVIRDLWYSESDPAKVWSIKFRLLCIFLAVAVTCIALLILRDAIEYPVDQKQDMNVTGIALPYRAPIEPNEAYLREP